MRQKTTTEDTIRSILETVVFIKEKVEGMDERFDTMDERFDAMDERFDTVEATLNQHTRQLTTIENSVEKDLDKRLMLEVRVTKLEQKTS